VVTASKHVSTARRCGHVDKLVHIPLRPEKTAHPQPPAYIEYIYKYSIVYIPHSTPKETMWTFCPHFVHIRQPLTTGAAT
jgi:hypothetical protein